MTAVTNPAKEYFPMPIEPVEGQPEWLPVDYPGVVEGYTVSMYGDARSPQGKILKPAVVGGSLQVALRLQQGTSTSARLDRLVLNAFTRPEPDLVPEHIDDDYRNCQLINLKWREPTTKEQASIKMGRSRRKTHIKAAKKKNAAVFKAASSKLDVVTLTRVYECNGVQVSVANSGEIVKMTPDPNRGHGLTAVQVRGLAKIMEDIAEMNMLMLRGNKL